jgi:hypothetical protein
MMKALRIFMQDNSKKNKKEEIICDKPEIDKELEVLLKEWEVLRAEAVSHLGAQYQLTNVALLLLGGLITLTTLPFISFGQGLHLTVPNLYFVVLLLVVSPLFSSLLHAFLSHQLDLGYFGGYAQNIIRKRICKLLELQKDSEFFSWDNYHQQQLTSKGRFGWFVAMMITSSHGAVVGILALLTWIAAIWAYGVNSSLFTNSIGMWGVLILLTFDTFYFLAVIPVAINAINTFRNLS